MRKRKIHEVKLSLFQDHATGDYGVTHKNTIDPDYGFNAFWGGIGIFHDVFEHWFEKDHKYFKDDYSMNRGGECAAMGTSFYYYSVLGVHNRPLNSYYYYGDSIRIENENAITEAIKYGYIRYGSTLECAVPKQKPLNDPELESQIKLLWDNIKDLRYSTDNHVSDVESSNRYKKSLTYRKIANLYRWGYRTAEKLVPDNTHNQKMCVEFIDLFNKFCKNNDAQGIFAWCNDIIFRIYKTKDQISWTAEFISKYPQEVKNQFINPEKMYLDF